MTKPKVVEGYRGPWMKFSRARSEAGFPIISVTKNGIGWKRLPSRESWDIITLLRGPDDDKSGEDKDLTTAQVRGLFLSWRYYRDMKAIDCTGCYARPPGYKPMPPLYDGDSLMSWHFKTHWSKVRKIILHCFGGWPVLKW